MSEVRIDARIDSAYGALPPQERRVADFLLEHLGDLAIFSAADISRETEVSKATVSRLFRKLGFEDFREVKEHARTLRSQGLPTASPVRSGGSGGSSDPGGADALERHGEQDRDNLTRMLGLLDDGRLDLAVEMLNAAKRVVVVGLRNSYPVALHLHQQLVQIRRDVRLAPQPGQTLGEELAGLGEKDLVVVFGFRRRPAILPRLVTALEQSEARTMMLGDGTARRYASQLDCWLECPVDSDGAFDSYAAPMSMVGLLANRVLNLRVAAGRRRISAVASAYEELDELEL